MIHEWAQDEFTISTDPARLDLDVVRDVFVLETWRGRGLSLWLMRTVVAHPELQGLRRWILLTRDAHRLYEKVGFTPLAAPERWMERWQPDAYAG